MSNIQRQGLEPVKEFCKETGKIKITSKSQANYEQKLFRNRMFTTNFE